MATPKKKKLRSTIILGAIAAMLSSTLSFGSTAMLFWFASGFAIATTVLEAYHFGWLLGAGLYFVSFIFMGPIFEGIVVTSAALLPVAVVGVVFGAVMAASIWGIYKLSLSNKLMPDEAISSVSTEIVTEKMSLKTIAVIAGIAAVCALGASITTALLAILAPSVLITLASLPAVVAGVAVIAAYCAAIYILEYVAAISIAAVAGLIVAALIPSIAVGALLALTYLGAFDPIFDYVKTKLGFEKIDHKIISDLTLSTNEVPKTDRFVLNNASNGSGVRLFPPVTAEFTSAASSASPGFGPLSQSDD